MFALPFILNLPALIANASQPTGEIPNFTAPARFPASKAERAAAMSGIKGRSLVFPSFFVRFGMVDKPKG